MQLFTIGLVQLNPDGSVKLSGGKPIDTYTREDVSGLAKVFTGLSWAGPDQANGRFNGSVADPERDSKPMQMYPAFHSTSEKRFLGQTISGATSGEDDIKLALDTLFNHPNAAPFFSRQLIQRLVTSNPSRRLCGPGLGRVCQQRQGRARRHAGHRARRAARRRSGGHGRQHHAHRQAARTPAAPGQLDARVRRQARQRHLQYLLPGRSLERPGGQSAECAVGLQFLPPFVCAAQLRHRQRGPGGA